MKVKKRYSKQAPLIPVEHPKVHCLYHVVWASRGVIGRCISVDHENQTVMLRSPKSKTDWKTPVKFSDLRHTRSAQTKIEKK
jgi:hypothetical protein